MAIVRRLTGLEGKMLCLVINMDMQISIVS